MKLILLAFLLATSAISADYRVGFARLDITPEGPIWLSGYANRKKPSDGVMHRLWVKALAIEDKKRSRVVIVTSDIIGLPRSIADVIGARIEKKYGLDRSRLLLNSSHTHTGPVIGSNLSVMYDLDEQNEKAVADYARKLADAFVDAAGAAMADLEPAVISFAQGSVGFATNRRAFTPEGVKLGVNPTGPKDHAVPVVRISKAGGAVKGVLFGYACHNTTLTGEHYQLSGDYAGEAQLNLEKSLPSGAAAMFLMLCGADQNPNPRTRPEHVQQHGQALASEVSRVLSGRLTTVQGDVRAAFQMKELPLAPHERSTFERMKESSDIYQRRLAGNMLKAYEERRPLRSVPYPVQALRLGRNLAIVGLGGEVVVDYALRTKQNFPKLNLIVAGYSNDVMCYIPTRQILKEGGYEAVQSMTYYGQPGPFAPEVEDIIHASIGEVMKRVGF